MADLVVVTGVIDTVVYHDEVSGYSVYILDVNQEPVTITGNFPEMHEGEILKVTGTYTLHKNYGKQLRAESWESIRSQDPAEIERYLAYGNTKGIGPILASVIVSRFGSETLDILDNDPDRLLEVPGIGQSKLEAIKASWLEEKNIRDVMMKMASVNISLRMAMKIFQKYGVTAVDQLHANPFRLADEIKGIGFKTADELAKKVGIPVDAPARIRAGIRYALEEALNSGHVYLPKKELMARASGLLNLEPAKILDTLNLLSKAEDQAQKESLVIEVLEDGTEAVYSSLYHYYETHTAELLINLCSLGTSRLGDHSLVPAVNYINRGQLSSKQAEAVEMAVTSRVSVLTGGPGTGKSHTLAVLIDVLEQMKKSYALAAPTGRAAKRMTEATGRPASTIHRLLNYVPDEEGDEDEAQLRLIPTEDEILRYDFIVCDEASMLDLPLAHRLLERIPQGVHILFVGDIDQLPAVGAGNFLRDIIDSGVVPVVRLDYVYRQGADSDIVANAHLVNTGQYPGVSNQKDFFIFTCSGGARAADLIVDIVSQRVPQKFGIPPKDIQVLSPMYAGESGVDNLNRRLQETLNPPSPIKREKRFSDNKLFRVHDRVLVIVNDYQKGVFNGDIGFITDLEDEQQTLYVDVDGKGITFQYEEVDKLVLAYATSIHKSQGSEFPCVVLAIFPENFRMLARNLVYTGITRARKCCVLVTNRRAVEIAIHNNTVARRYTALDSRLKKLASQNFA